MHARHPFTAVDRYSATARLFHWLTALLVVVAYIATGRGRASIRQSMISASGRTSCLACSVFALILVRLCWRTIFPSPKSPEMPAWMEVGAKLGQWALYALLVLVPVTAILGAWLEGHPLALLAVGNIDPWLPQSRHLGLALADIHGWLGNALMWLAGLHATAALYHHFWRRDTVLLSMLPGR
jgi:cytochrome b561